jgi:hypothetical protein
VAFANPCTKAMLPERGGVGIIIDTSPEAKGVA